MALYHNASKLRCRKMDWMRHPEWRWFTTLIDFDFDLMPRFCGVKIFGYIFPHDKICHRLSKGSNDLKNGPNVVANNFYGKKDKLFGSKKWTLTMN